MTQYYCHSRANQANINGMDTVKARKFKNILQHFSIAVKPDKEVS